MNDTECRHIEVLLVEDNPGDVRLTKEAFHEANKLIRVHVVSDGEEAMDFLTRHGVHAHAPRPDFILLDLNLPKLNGLEVLNHIKNTDDLTIIPTVVLTSSKAEEDVMKSYQLHASAYLIKPLNIDAFESLMKNISDVWLQEGQLPLRTPSMIVTGG